jgi:hypothetical protein
MYNVSRPQPIDCLCPPSRPGATPCPDINLEIRIESVVAGATPDSVVITYVVIDTNLLPVPGINTNLNYTWSVPSGHAFTQVGQHRIQITYNGSGGQIVIAVTATIPERPDCDYSAIYTQPTCIDQVITFEVQLDCNTNLITITACVNGNCNYDPNYLYQWYLPNAMGVQFLAANVIRLPPTQVLTDCTLEYLLFLFDVRTGCRTRQLVRRNLCDAPLLDECCNQPILNSLCSLWLICPPPNGCTVDIEVDGNAFYTCTQGGASITAYGDVVDVILLGGNHYIFKVLCNGRFTVRACGTPDTCLCPTTLTDGVARLPDRILLERCAEWDLPTTAGSSRAVTVDACLPCAPPYICSQLPPQPPNTFLVETTFFQSSGPSFPCANIQGGPNSLSNQSSANIFVFSAFPVIKAWIGQGDTIRVGVRLISPLPIPTLNGLLPSGFATPIDPYWDIVVTGNLLIRFDTNYIYTPSLPGTTISIDPC